MSDGASVLVRTRESAAFGEHESARHGAEVSDCGDGGLASVNAYQATKIVAGDHADGALAESESGVAATLRSTLTDVYLGGRR